MMGSMVIENAPTTTTSGAEAVVSSTRQPPQRSQQSPMSLKKTLSPKSIRSVVSPKKSVYSKVFHHHHPKPCMFLGRSKSARTLCSSKDLACNTSPHDEDDDDDDDEEYYEEEEEEEDATVTMGSSSFMFKTVTRDSLMLEQRKHSSMSYLNRRRSGSSSQFDNVLVCQDDNDGDRSKQHQQRNNNDSNVDIASNLSFADAKRIWMREWLKSQQQLCRSCEKDNNEQQQHTYIESSFDYNDLERSLRQQQQQQESTMPRRIDFAGTVFGPSRLSSTRTSSTCTSNSSLISHPITEEEEAEEEENHRVPNKSVEQENSAAATVLSTIYDTTTTNTSPDTAGSSSSRTVTFTTITIQEYPMIPGVSPGGTYGVPVTIDWIPYDPVTIDLQSYEKWRVPNRRNHQQEMQIPWFHREKILKRLGFNQRQIREASRQAAIGRKQRRTSNSTTTFYLEDTLYRLELMIRTIRNILTLGQKKRKEREYLAQCNNVSFCKQGTTSN